MTNERFIIDCNGIIDTWKENRDCNDKLTWKELCNTLNELHEENEELKKENQRMTDKLNKIALELKYLEDVITTF